MLGSTLFIKRFLHDRKLPGITGYTLKQTFIKSSEISPKKSDYNLYVNNNIHNSNTNLTHKKYNNSNISWVNFKKYGWFTN
jgi:hypothetical protein